MGSRASYLQQPVDERLAHGRVQHAVDDDLAGVQARAVVDQADHVVGRGHRERRVCKGRPHTQQQRFRDRSCLMCTGG